MRWVHVAGAASATLLVAACGSLFGVDDVVVAERAGGERPDVRPIGDGGDAPAEECPDEPTIVQEAGGTASSDCIPCGYPEPTCVLGDRLNCGWCGHRCPENAGCTSGVCEPKIVYTAPQFNGTLLLTTAGYHLWASGTALVRVALDGDDGGTPLTDLGAGAGDLQSVRQDETYDFVRTTEFVYAVPQSGGNAIALSSASLGGAASLGLLGESVITPSNAKVFAFFKDGGAPMELAAAESYPDWIATADAPPRAYWTTTSFVDGGALPEGGAIHSWDQGGVHHVLDGLTEPRHLVRDGSYLYFVEKADGTLWRMPLAGGPQQLLARTPSAFPFVHTLVVDERHVYWLAGPTAIGGPEREQLYRVSKCPGGNVTTIARNVYEGSTSYSGAPLTQSGDYVYWSYDRYIVRAPK
jgi:hypothetical protein